METTTTQSSSLALAPRSAMLIAGSIFSMISACLCFIISIIGFTGLLYYGNQPPELWMMGALGMMGFVFGLGGGVLSLERTHYTIIIVGEIIMILAPILPYVIALQRFSDLYVLYGLTMALLIFGAPAITLSSLAILSSQLKEMNFQSLCRDHTEVF